MWARRVGVVVGLAQGVLITVLKIDSIIATLGMSSLLTALTDWVSGSQQILNLPSGLESLALNRDRAQFDLTVVVEEHDDEIFGVIAAAEPQRVKFINGNLPADIVCAKVWDVVEPLLPSVGRW